MGANFHTYGDFRAPTELSEHPRRFPSTYGYFRAPTEIPEYPRRFPSTHKDFRTYGDSRVLTYPRQPTLVVDLLMTTPLPINA